MFHNAFLKEELITDGKKARLLERESKLREDIFKKSSRVLGILVAVQS